MPGLERHGSQDSDVNAAPSLRLYAGSPRIKSSWVPVDFRLGRGPTLEVRPCGSPRSSTSLSKDPRTGTTSMNHWFGSTLWTRWDGIMTQTSQLRQSPVPGTAATGGNTSANRATPRWPS